MKTTPAFYLLRIAAISDCFNYSRPLLVTFTTDTERQIIKTFCYRRTAIRARRLYLLVPY
jgi:hypothetical protein